MDDSHHLKTELYNLVSSHPEIFEILYKSSLDGIWYWDKNSDEEWMSPEFWRLFGYNPDEKKHLASEWHEIIHAEDLKLAIENFQKHCDDPAHPYDQIVRYKHQDGSTVWVRCRGGGIRNKDGKVTRMFGAHTDVTPLKTIEEQLIKANERLAKLSLEDSMTGLLNRDGLLEKFEEYLLICQRQQLPLSIAFLDIDNFKTINDKYGHIIGDDYLKAIAECLKSTQRATDKIARLGGDEFLVLMLDTNTKQAECAAERIRKQIQENFGNTGSITVSIGVVSLSSEDTMDNHESPQISHIFSIR